MIAKFQRKRSTPSALAGASVVVTRPAASAGAFRRRIVALGGMPLSLPGFSLRAADDTLAARAAVRAACNADLAVFVSPSAVRYAFELLPQLRFAKATHVCAIGAGTARALARHGLHDVLWPRQRQDSEGLLQLPFLARLRGRRVALIGAPGGRDTLPETLRLRGAHVEHVNVYRRALPRLDRRHFDALAAASAPLIVLLSSAQALANLRAGLPAPLFARLAAGEGIVSSLRLASAARMAGFERVHIAASADPVDMLITAAAALARHRL